MFLFHNVRTQKNDKNKQTFFVQVLTKILCVFRCGNEMQWNYRLMILRKSTFVYRSIKEFEQKFYTTCHFFDEILNKRNFLKINNLCLQV